MNRPSIMSLSRSPTYVVITPIRNEEEYLPLTVASMVAQTVKPRQWILVNDGSSDRTGELIDAAAATYSWITAVHRRDRGSRQAGTGVIAAFYDGFEAIADPEWDFVVKFDGDLSFDPDYFERCLAEFVSDATLGIVGGTCCKIVDNKCVPEFAGEPLFHVRGPTKLYRRECFEAIGGLIMAPGWDTIDQMKANMLGWRTLTLSHIRLIHHRPTGRAYGSWSNSVKNGLANYITGYHPAFMLVKCLKRCAQKPYLIDAVGLGWGYCRGFLTRTARVSDAGLIEYIRQQQLNKLLFRPSLW